MRLWVAFKKILKQEVIYTKRHSFVINMEKLKSQTITLNGVRVRVMHAGQLLPNRLQSAVKAKNSRELRRLANRVITF